MPRDLSYCSFDGVGVLEDHDRLRGDWLTHVLRLFSIEVLLEQVELVVLPNTSGGSLDQILRCWRESELRLFIESSHVLSHFVRLGVVESCGPTTDIVLHAAVHSGDPLCIHLNSN